MLPAFTGLGAPYWDAEAQGSLWHYPRDQRQDLVKATCSLWPGPGRGRHRTKMPGSRFRPCGGRRCIQCLPAPVQADLLGVKDRKSRDLETTGLGVAFWPAWPSATGMTWPACRRLPRSGQPRALMGQAESGHLCRLAAGRWPPGSLPKSGF